MSFPVACQISPTIVSETRLNTLVPKQRGQDVMIMTRALDVHGVWDPNKNVVSSSQTKIDAGGTHSGLPSEECP